jgi:hypothetical protein
MDVDMSERSTSGQLVEFTTDCRQVWVRDGHF